MLTKLKEKNPALWQFILYALLSLIATAVELASFALMDFWLFRPMKQTDFHWWILHYSGSDGGGLGGFLATAISYALAQITNFILQRKKTFQANNNPVFSAIAYAVMVVGIWFFQIFLSGVLMAAFRPALGATWGDLASKAINMVISFAIQFPLNKFVIMRKKKATA